eukprot:2945805-Pleurochrysis_carterae.AAC.1
MSSLCCAERSRRECERGRLLVRARERSCSHVRAWPTLSAYLYTHHERLRQTRGAEAARTRAVDGKSQRSERASESESDGGKGMRRREGQLRKGTKLE